MKTKTVTLLHPGNMGATIGASVTGARVLWVSDGRSEGTRRRAEKSGLLEAATLAEAVADSDAVLSVCPPHAAEDVAQSVAALGFAGLYVDANAVSRATAQRVGEAVQEGGAAFVDGAIIGPPVTKPDRTRLYLSGAGGGCGGGTVLGEHARRQGHRGRLGSGFRPQDDLRRVDQGQRRPDPRDPRAGGAGGRGEGAAGGVVTIPTQPSRQERARGLGGRAQGLALRGRDGGDCQPASRRPDCPRASTRPRPTSTAGWRRSRTAAIRGPRSRKSSMPSWRFSGLRSSGLRLPPRWP